MYAYLLRNPNTQATIDKSSCNSIFFSQTSSKPETIALLIIRGNLQQPASIVSILFKQRANVFTRNLAARTTLMKFTRKILFFIVPATLLIAFGISLERVKFFPYYQVLELYQRNITKAQKALGIETERPIEAKAIKPDFELTKRQIPSALLPLQLSGIQLNARHTLATTGGSITVVGNQIVIADRLDKFYIYDTESKTTRSAEYPSLPSNREAFYKWGKYGKSELFRLHDIEYVEIAGKGYLIAAHESFDIKQQMTRMAVHRLQIDPVLLSTTETWELVFESTPLPPHKDYFANGAGGRLVADKNSVYLTIGDYNQDGVFIPMKPPFPAQVKSSDFGSIIKLDILTGTRETISYGHRNPQGIMISEKGELISTEHGPRGGDELNLIKPGRNYGWPDVSFGMDYPTYSWPFNGTQGRHKGFEAPIFSWVPSIATSNLIEVRGFNDRWDNDLLVASLKASSLFRIRRNGARVVYAEPIWIGQRIRDLAQMKNGTIVLWTDQTQLLFLSVDDAQLSANQFAGIQSVSIKLGTCLKCHHLGPTNPAHPAPSLSNLLNRPVASDKGFKTYSSALKNLGGDWTRKRLTQFLMNPSEFAPGTLMAIEPMTDLRKIRKLIDELERAK